MEVERQRIADALPAYEVGGVVGQGGFGVVLAGRHRQLDRRVAIKQLSRTVAADVAVRRRFAAEARVLASLDHPHVVPVYDFVEREDLCLLVMELLPGGTLRDRSTTTGFTAPHAVAISLACAAGLTAAHERGVLHRDVKPENMLFAASGALKVTDFGIAKVVGGTETLLTRAGEVVGTPAYMAPEQVRGGELSPATDVYALATMTYELLSGVLPFTADGNAMSLLFKHVHEAPIPLREVAPGVPTPVADAVMHGLTTDPAERFASAVSFGTALAEAGTEAWGGGWPLCVTGVTVEAGRGQPATSGLPLLGGPTNAARPSGPAPRPSPPATPRQPVTLRRIRSSVAATRARSSASRPARSCSSCARAASRNRSNSCRPVAVSATRCTLRLPGSRLRATSPAASIASSCWVSVAARTPSASASSR